MTDLASLETTLAQRQRAYDRLAGEARIRVESHKTLTEQVATLDSELLALDQAIAVLSSYVEQRQGDLQTKIETLVTHGLRTIFEQDLSFHIITSTRGKLQATDFVIRSILNGQEVETSVLDSRGGGVAAVAGFLLRLIVLLFSKRTADPIIFLDESFAHLSADLEGRLSAFIRELVDKTDVQIIMVTHSDAFFEDADKVFRFDLHDGKTQITVQK